jgi:uncharacterized protein
MSPLRLLLAALFALLLAFPLAAQLPGPYEGEAVVASQGDAERNAALPQALQQVLVKLSGDSQVSVGDALAEAPRLLRGYRYRQLDGGRLALVAQFDRAGVEAMLVAAGQRIWAEPRPQPVLWLAIDDGRGPRLVGSAQAQAVGALGQRAAARGLRLNFPLLDLEDQRQLDVRQVWNLDHGAVQAATARYQSEVALLGKLYRSGSGWTIEWRLLAEGMLLQQERQSGPEAGALLALGADLAADALAARHVSQVHSAGPAGRYTVWIDNVHSAEDYARLIGHLQQQPAVRGLQPLAARGAALQLDLELDTGIDGFGRQLQAAGVLQLLPAAGGERERRFRLEP